MSVIAELKAIFGADTAPYKAATKEVTSLTSSLQKSISGIGSMLAGAFSVGAITIFTKHMMNVSHELRESAEAIDISLNSMVALNTAATESGLGVEKLQRIMGKLRNAQGEVISGNKSTIEILEKLNITQEKFVGLGVDELLALIAEKYNAAGGSADAFNAVTSLFGQKIGPALQAMLNIINEEGLGKMKAAAADATQGINDLADAQEKLNKLQGHVIIKTGGLIGWLEEIARLGKAAWGSLNWLEKLDILSGYFAFRALITGGKRMYEAGKKVFLEGPETNTPVSVNDLSKNNDLRALKKRQDAEAKKITDDATKKAQELGRYYYFKELHNQDEIDKLYEEYADKIGGLYKPGAVKGVGATVDTRMRIGGLVGGSRPGLAVEDRQTKILEESKHIWEDMSKKLQRLIEKQEDIRDRNEG